MRDGAIALAVSLLTLTGCAQDESSDQTDPASAPQAVTGLAGEVSTFYKTRPDTRRCAWPACGGTWVSRVNKPTTLCADGAYRAECYVVEVQNSAGLDDWEWDAARAKPHIVRADMVALATPVGYGALRASEIWDAYDAEPAGATYYQITDKQIRCFANPCFSLREATLNKTSATNLSGMSGRLGVEAGEQLAQGKVIVSGRNQHTTDGGKVVMVDQLYIRAEHQSGTCAEYTTTDGRFYAKNFPGDQQAEAEAWVAADAEVVSSGIGIGTCLAWNEKPCDPQDPPVCGLPVVTDVASTYSSLCEFRKVIREYAGTTGESKGKFREGACQGYCASALIQTPTVDTRTLYAKSFLWPDYAHVWLDTNFPGNIYNLIELGLCGEQPACGEGIYAPVCGTIRSGAPVAYDSPCLFVAALMDDAGAGESQGYWNTGECAAPAGWVTPLTVNIASLARDAQLYYELAVPAGATSVEITTTGGIGDADLYVHQTTTPTEYDYDCRSWESGNEELCSFTAPAAGVTYEIMIHGYNLTSTNFTLVGKYYQP
jgi:hypothetical protein